MLKWLIVVNHHLPVYFRPQKRNVMFAEKALLFFSSRGEHSDEKYIIFFM